MLPDRVSNPGPLAYESGALPIALRGPAPHFMIGFLSICTRHRKFGIFNDFLLSATPSYLLRYIFWTKMNFT